MPSALTRLHRGSFLLLVCALALLTGFAVSSQRGPSVDALVLASKNGPAGGGSESGSFEIKGSVTGLYPGGQLTLPVKLENYSNVAIRVQSLTVKASNANPGCSADNLAFGPALTPKTATVATNLTIPANGELLTQIPISLLPSAGDACQQATFPLTYTGTAVKA